MLFRANRRILDEAELMDVSLGEGESLRGLIHPREGLLLYMLARRAAQIGPAVEIGAYLGKSTWYLARGLMDAGSPHRVITIDPFPGNHFDLFRRVLAARHVLEHVDARVGLSHEVVKNVDAPVGLLWIDGDHAYRSVRRDFEEWFPKLAPGGWLALHDTVNAWEGPTRLVRELFPRRDDLREVGVVHITTYAKKARSARANHISGLRGRVGFELLTIAQARHAGIHPQSRDSWPRSYSSQIGR